MAAYAGTPRVLSFADDGVFPNSALPLLIYPEVLAPETVDAAGLEALLEGHGWVPAFRATIYDFAHYHSNTHEVLAVAQGNARVRFGGAEGRTVRLAAGDAVLIPAGVAHQRIAESDGFVVVGAYPPGFVPDLMRGEAGERPDADARIAALAVPEGDPFTGAEGGLGRYWR